MNWLFVLGVAVACLVVALVVVMRLDPAGDDYPAEHGDGED